MKKGFTLLELLLVIGILAILSTVAVLVLQPAELLRQARDSQRISDLQAINKALLACLAGVRTVSLGSGSTFYSYVASASSTYGTGCSGGGLGTSPTVAVNRGITGSGWLPVNFAAIPGGSPLSVLPIDPVGTVASQFVYLYRTDGSSSWELNANLESIRYSNTGGTQSDAESSDGGSCSTIYEIGNDPGLDL